MQITETEWEGKSIGGLRLVKGPLASTRPEPHRESQQVAKMKGLLQTGEGRELRSPTVAAKTTPRESAWADMRTLVGGQDNPSTCSAQPAGWVKEPQHFTSPG